MMCASADAGQGVEPPLQPSELVVSVRATLPSLALMLIGVESVTSAVGSAAPLAPPEASCTNRYLPGASVPDSGVITFVALPKLPVPRRVGAVELPAGGRPGRRAAVEQLDVVVQVRGAAVAAATVDLADHDRRRAGAGRRPDEHERRARGCSRAQKQLRGLPEHEFPPPPLTGRTRGTLPRPAEGV